MYPYVITGSVGGATPTQITISPVLRDAVVNDANITIFASGAVDLVAGYAAGYSKEIHIDGLTNGKAPQVGQIVQFGTNVYTIIEATLDVGGLEGDFLLNRPLVASIANNDVANFGPAGSYNFLFAPEALALVSRPLAAPMSRVGAMAAVVSDFGMSARVVITYNGTKQGHLVTVDMLCGLAVLDVDQGCVMLA